MTYNNHRKSEYQYFKGKLEGSLNIVYVDPQNAQREIFKHIERKGIKKTISKIKERPSYFSKVRGKSFLKHSNAERNNALYFIPKMASYLGEFYSAGIQHASALDMKSRSNDELER